MPKKREELSDERIVQLVYIDQVITGPDFHDLPIARTHGVTADVGLIIGKLNPVPRNGQNKKGYTKGPRW